jgi:hypothetical protein
MATDFWGNKSVIRVNVLPRETTVNSDGYTETQRNPNACFCPVLSTAGISELLQHHNKTKPHQSVRTEVIFAVLE